MPWAGSMPSVDESEAHCRRQQARFLLREDFVYFMLARDASGGDGELVGATGLHRIDWTLRKFEIGYWRKTGCDGRGFVTGIGVLDKAARSAGVPVVAGASSVPALSGAVVRALAAEDAVRQVEIAISASNRAVAGRSVAAAILSYVGKPIALWRGRRADTGIGWQELRRECFTLAGARPLRRRVALADVPDSEREEHAGKWLLLAGLDRLL